MILETVFHVVPLNGTFCLLAVLYILIQLDVVQHEATLRPKMLAEFEQENHRVFALLLLFCRQYRVAKTALAVYGPSYLLAFHVHLSSCNKVGIVHNCIVLCIRALLQVPASWLGALDLHGGARICARYIYAIDCARAFAICISTDVMLACQAK